MTNRNLRVTLFALTGLSIPAASQADVRSPVVTQAIASSPADFAPITDPNTSDPASPKPGRLRRTDEEQPGNEMAHLAFFKDATGKVVADPAKYSGLMFSMTTDLVDPAAPTVSHRANDRIQLSLVPFKLVNTAGAVAAVPEYTGLGTNTETTGGVRFVTNNNGNEYRNANHPVAYTVGQGNVICAEYNYQPNNGNNTNRYLQCFNSMGATILPQTRIYAKTNDDCSMNQDKASTTVAKVSPDGLTTHLVAWRGCNGNGDDDGWATSFTIKLDSATAPTKATFKQVTDVSLCPREERSHGFCSVSDADPDTAICSWTEGNTQPQRDGTWLAAIDISGQTNGQNSIYWKHQIDGRKQLPNGNRTYSMRAMTDRIMLPDASGNLVRTDMIVWRSGDVRGNNNGNAKGGTYFGNQMAVIQADKTGYKYKVPLQDMSTKLLGLDGTHLGMVYGVFGTTDHPMPGLALVSGSHTAAAYGAQMRVIGIDQAGGIFNDLGSSTVGPYDRHLYPNYLGNNPGNQGRNYLGAEFIANPFATGAAGENAYLMVFASTSKPSGQTLGGGQAVEADEQPSATCLDCAKRKLAAYISVVPVAQAPAAPQGQGSGSGSGSGSGGGSGSDVGNGSGSGSSQPTDPTDPTTDPSTDPGTSLGGCSTGNGAGGAASLLLIGLAAFIRRRK